MTASQ